MSREFKEEKRDMRLTEEDWDSLLEDDDGFDAAVKEEYMKEAEEIERSLFPEGMPRDSADSREEIRASYEKLVALMKEKGIYREDVPADCAAVDSVSMGNALAADAETDSDAGDPVGNALAFASGTGEAAGIGTEISSGSGRERTRRAMLRQFKMVRAAGVAVACLLGVCLAAMTSEANREYVVDSFKVLIGDKGDIVVDNDDKNEEALRDEEKIREKISAEIGAQVPELKYRPDSFEFYDYNIYAESTTASMEYMYNDNIIELYIDNNYDGLSSRNYSSHGTDQAVYYLENDGMTIKVTETIDAEEEIPGYIAQWERKNVFYQFSGRMEKEIFEKIVKNIVYY